jgi:hypothetical protein
MILWTYILDSFTFSETALILILGSSTRIYSIWDFNDVSIDILGLPESFSNSNTSF